MAQVQKSKVNVFVDGIGNVPTDDNPGSHLLDLVFDGLKATFDYPNFFLSLLGNVVTPEQKNEQLGFSSR